ncbi:hypothetical protein [Streptomyces roseoverticillatus]|uniref:Uncharacterized protein n=1 Tax=Streptomyces roseoverticillatus TaxID=66429 RepID=A0ABV3J5B4_9ACTN
MVLSVSVVVLLGIALFVLLRTGYVRAGSAITAVLFGFFLASTGIAPTITQVLNSTATALTHIGR